MTANKNITGRRIAVWLAAAAVAAALFLGGLAGVMISARADETGTVIANGTDERLDATYETGDTFTLPKNVFLSDGGQNFEASVLLRDPDGNGYTAASVTLKEAGLYTVEYRAEGEGGKFLSAKQTFSCVQPLFAVSSPKSSAAYVESKALQNDVTGAAGIDISLAKNDTFTFHQIIDLSDAAAADPFIAFYVTPQVLYQYDIARINIVLTDPFDPENKVTLAVKRVLLNDDIYMYRTSYVTASAANQPETGLETGSSSQYPTVIVDGVTYKLHQDDAYGAPCRHSMYGGWDQMPNEGMLGQELRLSFDAATNRFYTWDIGAAATPKLIADLDDPALFDNLWTGFTDGKAILSVEMASYRALTGNMVITKIADADLTKEYASDGQGPVVSVDLSGYEAGSLPEARLGGKYPIFEASATDETDGTVPVYASVWYNYASESTRTRVTVTDSAFTPEIAGTYTIVYSAKDRTGNVTDVALNVTAEAIDALAVTYDKGTAQTTAGQKYTVSGVRLSGGSGDKKLGVTAALPGNAAASYELTADGEGNYSFVPLYEGTYTVTFTYSDWLESKTESFTLSVGAAEGAYIAEEASVPRYLISGATYEIPALWGYTFEGGPSEENCTVSITGGTVSGNTFKVTATEGNVTLTYTLETAGKTPAVKTYTVPVIAGTGLGQENALDMSKFFVDSNYDAGHASYERRNVNLAFDGEGYRANLIASVKNSNPDKMAYGSFDFINKVLASSMKADFSLSQTNFMRVVIYVTDSVNPSQQVKLTFGNGGGWKMTFSVNDGYTYATSYNGASAVSVRYNDETKAFVTDTNISAPVSAYLGGEPFNGFSSGFVYLTFRIEGVYAAASGEQTGAIRVTSINNQTISGTKTDNFTPEVTAYVSKGDLAAGTVTEIPAFMGCDVLDPYVTISVSVTSPSGKTVTSTDGVLLDGTQDNGRAYEIRLSEYGSYQIGVTGTVGTTSQAPDATYGIKVVDMSPPTVEFGAAVTEAKVGETVPFASVKISDDTTDAKDIKVTAYLMTPAGKIVEVNYKEYGSFIASEAGEYRFIIYACDAGNLYGSTTVSNTAIVSYAITVTA